MFETKKLPCGRDLNYKSTVTKEQVKELQDRLKNYLAENGLKQSGARWNIAELVLKSETHMNAQELVNLVNSKYPHIGAATVYRSLKVLTDAKILRECAVSSSGGNVYECFEESHHDHVVCADCGHIFEFHDDNIELLQNQVLKKMNFEQVSHRHVLYAKCEFK